jgi:hypothetical protein
MTTDFPLLTLVNPTELTLEFPAGTLERLWQQTQAFSSPSSRWQAYQNQACLEAFLPWLQEQAPGAKVWPNRAALASFWEVVNGVAIDFEGARLVLIPTDAIDASELRVPQEWVDLPSWAADYYLGVQFNPDEGYLRVYGYTTHRQLKRQGTYDPSDRAYCLEAEELIADLSVLWVARQLCPEEVLRDEVASLAPLSLAHAENLLERLGNSSLLVPRWEIPFVMWGALLEHGGWRQRLYEKRLGMGEQWSVWQWLESGISQAAIQVGWSRLKLQPSLVGARGNAPAAPVTALCRQLAIADHPYELRVFSHRTDGTLIWRFELRSTHSDRLIPAGFKLRLLTEALQPFENNEDAATIPSDLLYVEVSLAEGEGLVWEIDPLPDNYEREILRF